MVHSTGRFKISERGFWESSSGIGHWCDLGLANEIGKFLQEEKANGVIDYGCGMAFYSRVLIEHGLKCLGLDGNPNTEKLTNGIGKVQDLSLPISLPENSDWALALEVGGHIPMEFESTFIDNICKHTNKGIILSWEIPTMITTGDGHYNCRTNEYIIFTLKNKKFSFDHILTARLKNASGDPAGLRRPGYYDESGQFIQDKDKGYDPVDMSPGTAAWFKKTLMVFRKDV